MELARYDARVELEAPVTLRLSQALAKRGERDEAVRALRSALAAAGASREPELMVRIARAARDLDPDLARSAARLVLERPGLDGADRQWAERLLSLGQVTK